MDESLTCYDLKLFRLAETRRSACGENDAADIVRMTRHSLILIVDRKRRSTC